VKREAGAKTTVTVTAMHIPNPVAKRMLLLALSDKHSSSAQLRTELTCFFFTRLNVRNILLVKPDELEP
jgi:hypothetical protein